MNDSSKNLTASNRLGTPKKVLNPKYSIQIDSHEGYFADPKVLRSLLLLMNQGAVNGGAACHWGGPTAIAELVSVVHEAVFKNPENWMNEYNLVNDIGHAENIFYSIKAMYNFSGLTFDDLKGFRSIESKLSGHGEAHLFPEGVLLSNGPLSSSLAAAQGLSLGDKLNSQKDKKTICFISDGACMEGEAKEALSSIPGLFSKNLMNPFLLIISDNDTKLGGRISKDSFSMRHSFDSLSTLGWNVITVEDGHNISLVKEKFDQALKETNNERPVVLLVKTVKGKGLKITEESSSGGHGYPGKAFATDILNYINEIWENDAPYEFTKWASDLTVRPEIDNNQIATETIKSEKVQVGVSKALIRAVKNGSKIFSISSDLAGSTGVKDFQKEYPDHFIDIGIAESNMVSIAAGLSQTGHIPVVDTFASFGVTKGNLPLIMNSLSKGSLIAYFSHIGFQDAADGASHQSLTYLSAVSNIPNVSVHLLSTSKEAYELSLQAIKEIEIAREKNRTPKSFIFFLGRENFPCELIDQKNYNLYKGEVISSGDDGLIITNGTLLHQALRANNLAKTKGKSFTIINHNCANQIDIELIKEELGKLKTKKILSTEDHQVKGGFGAYLAHELLLNNVSCTFTSIGVNGEFGRSAYLADQLYAHYQIDAQSILYKMEN